MGFLLKDVATNQRLTRKELLQPLWLKKVKGVSVLVTAQEWGLWVAAPGLPLWDHHGAAGELIPFLGRWEAAERATKLSVTWPGEPYSRWASSQEHITSSERLLCTSLTGGCYLRYNQSPLFSGDDPEPGDTKRTTVSVWGLCWVGVAGAHQPWAAKWSMSLVLATHGLGFSAVMEIRDFYQSFWSSVWAWTPSGACALMKQRWSGQRCRGDGQNEQSRKEKPSIISFIYYLTERYFRPVTTANHISLVQEGLAEQVGALPFCRFPFPASSTG